MTPQAAETETAWAIGLFEGEGTIFITRRGYASARIGIGMTDRDVIERWVAICPGGGKIMTKRLNYPGSKPIYWYEINRRDVVEEFLLRIKPWLSVKKTAECDRALMVIAEARARARKKPTYRREHKTLTGAEMVQIRAMRAALVPAADVAAAFRISVTHVYRVARGCT